MKEQEQKPSNPDLYKGEVYMLQDRVTLRDYFANSAMQATDLEAYAEKFGADYERHVASDSYKLADAMLKQREL